MVDVILFVYRVHGMDKYPYSLTYKQQNQFR